MTRLLVLIALSACACSSEPESLLPAEPNSVETPLATPEQAALWGGSYTFEDVRGDDVWKHALQLKVPDSLAVLIGTYSVDGWQAEIRMNVRADVRGDSATVVLTSYAPGNVSELATAGDVLFVLIRPPERTGLLETRWRAAQPYANAPLANSSSFRRAAELVVEAGGLRSINPISGAARPLPFGLTRDRVLGAVVAMRGEPHETYSNDECGAGPVDFAEWTDGLVLLFQDDRFAGWHASARERVEESAPMTIAGIGPWSTWSDVQDAYSAEKRETTLGSEFTIGGDLFGILDGEGPDARIDLLWSGVSCFFR